MRITVIAVGKLKEKYLKDGAAEYIKRLSRFCGIQVVEVDDEPAVESLSAAREDQIRKKEAERILKKYTDASLLIALDIKGVKLDSEGFAAKLQGYFVSGVSDVTFVIGGSLGLDAAFANKAALKLSISDMTFPHQLARLILLEQVYRAFKIINGEPYHK